jgi:septum site-determining protein MinC
MTDNALKSKAFKLKGRLYTLTALHILDTDYAQLSAQLAYAVAQAPLLFQNSPIVFDLSALAGESIDLERLYECAHRHGLLPVAIQGGSSAVNQRAKTLGLALLNASSTQDKPMTEEVNKTKIVTTPVRSGQQIVSKGADLIVASSVSRGAELLSEGHIHVYGILRGKALAGIAGDRNARIFCQGFDAELVSIAGIYQLRDNSPVHIGPCQIYIQDERIRVEPL